MNNRFIDLARLAAFSTVLYLIACTPQEENFILIGDVHYDLLENHDIDWLTQKGDDLRQVTKGYTIYTADNWQAFSATIKEEALDADAVVQLGDMSEGLAGTPELAVQMADSVFAAIDRIGIEIPFIMTKGNHDITGPGAKEAFNEVYLPNIKRLAQLEEQPATGNYSKQVGNCLFVAFDPWAGSDESLAALEENLTSSDAQFKFVTVHEPIIPVNERCWHVLRRHDDKREKLLEIIAKNHAIILCAHLHLYSIVRRDTEWGPIVQILVNSVIRDQEMTEPKEYRDEYGAKLALDVPNWQPETMEQRCGWLEAEAPFVKYFKVMDLPGYARLTVNSRKNEITLRYYAACGHEPYETVNISDILK